jgi:hypothetical protein
VDASVIDRYVADLDGRLLGPRAVKADMVTEARDSLTDAFEAHLESGVSARVAEHRAVEEFGPVGVIAKEYQAELAVAAGTRTLVTFAITLPLMHVFWELNRWLWIGAWSPHMSVTPPPWYLWLAKTNDLISGITAGVVLVALVAGRLLCRRRTPAAVVGRAAGWLAAAVVGVVMAGNIGIMAGTWVVDARMLFLSPPVAIGSLLSAVMIGWLGVLARRSLRCATIVT